MGLITFASQADFDYVTNHPWFTSDIRWAASNPKDHTPVLGIPGTNESTGELIVSDPRLNAYDQVVVDMLLKDRGDNRGQARARDARFRASIAAAKGLLNANAKAGKDALRQAAEANATEAGVFSRKPNA